MRLKTFSAPTMAAAMDLVRDELGPDAIIVSSQQGPGGGPARVTAALERADEAPLDPRAMSVPSPDAIARARSALAFHGAPLALAERLLAAAETAFGEDPFAMALDAEFLFAPLADAPQGKPLMLVGPPGMGKTVSTAKLAARAVMAGGTAGVVTMDTKRAGGVDQLEALTRLLGLNLVLADAPADLPDAVGTCPLAAPIIIDTAGTNPFNDSEMEQLGESITVSGADAVLVLSAGGDAMESAEIAQAFAGVGATRLLVTRIDMARRLGAMLAAADAAKLRFCDVSVTPHVADGLSAITPTALARLLIPNGAEFDETVKNEKRT